MLRFRSQAPLPRVVLATTRIPERMRRQTPLLWSEWMLQLLD